MVLVNLQTQQRTEITADNPALAPNGFSTYPVISGSGRFVAFYQFDSGEANVYLFDTTDGSTERVSNTLVTGQTSDGRLPAFSANEGSVWFLSRERLIESDETDLTDLYSYDIETGEIDLVEITPTGDQPDASLTFFSPSADGRYVAIITEATNIVPGDENGHADVYLYDRVFGCSRRLSEASDGADANAPSRDVYMSQDGSTIFFESEADNLTAGINQPYRDVFRVPNPFETSPVRFSSGFEPEDDDYCASL